MSRYLKLKTVILAIAAFVAFVQPAFAKWYLIIPPVFSGNVYGSVSSPLSLWSRGGQTYETANECDAAQEQFVQYCLENPGATLMTKMGSAQMGFVQAVNVKCVADTDPHLPDKFLPGL